jgi:N-methylhydantoinase B/oxoprolinase/acetone carboxylase alpha subunit
MTDLSDPFAAEVLRSYLVSTVREMVITTTRTAFSTCFCHGEDFTCGLFDAQGRMIAQDQGVGVHAGGLGGAVASVMQVAGDSLAAGDVFLHNDPYDGATHQADVCVIRPIYVDGTHLGFAANRGHWTDVGSMSPGGWSGAAQDVVQEGLLMPGVRLYRAGELQRDIAQLILRNVRLSEQCWGDIQAQIASAIAAERRIEALVAKDGVEGLDAAIEAAFSYTERRFLAALARLPDGEASGEDVIEDDGRGGGPIPIRVRIRKQGGTFSADFTGSADHQMAPINCTFACTRAAVIGSLVACIDPEIPLNEALIKRIDVIAPLGSIVNPTYPAPTFGTTADPANRVMETMLLALDELTPDRVPAGSYSTGQNVTGGGLTESGDEFLWYSYQSGGTGAWVGGDGNNGEWHLMANSKNESMEAWELRYPLRFLEYSLVADSGGPGRWRGGLGTRRRLLLEADTRLSGIADHHMIGARGKQGGGVGRPNGFSLERDGKVGSLQDHFGLQSPSKFSNLSAKRGDVFVSTQGGGGGVGDPSERGAEQVMADLLDEYISDEAARTQYGRDL